jgi:hypothetical protein
MAKKKKDIESLENEIRLAEILNDSPRKIKLGKKEFLIKALRPGTQYLLAAEAARIAKAEETFSDIIKHFAENVPSVIRCITLAVLNDKDKINGDEYQAMYDYIQWETNPNEWLTVLVNVLQMLDVKFFFRLTSQIDLFREMTLTKKKEIDEQSLSPQQAK